MSKYKLLLRSDFSKPTSIELFPFEQEFVYQIHESDDNYVFDNFNYSIEVINESGEGVSVEKCRINDEWYDTKEKGKPFKDCYGVIKITACIEGVEYISPNISVFVSGNEQNINVENMVGYIYDNCEDFLYENHSKNEVPNGLKEKGNRSVQAKILLLKEIEDLYLRLKSFFTHSPYSRLINSNKVDSFEKLQDVTSQTIRHIITHVDELRLTDINSGINYNGQYYQPKNTLVRSVGYTRNNYENQCVLAFLKELIIAMQEMQSSVDSMLNETKRYREINGYKESKYFIFRKSRESLQKYHDQIEKLSTNFRKLYFDYKRILNVSVIELKGVPRFTPVFRRLIPYRQIFNAMHKWFYSGNYDLSKEDLLLSFLSTSKIYEYYCLLKIKSALNKNGFTFDKGYRYTYKEDFYYENTKYNNTFCFVNNDIRLTLYFQPKVQSGDDLEKGIPNSIDLFRSTSFSLNGGNNRHYSYYTPDYIIKVDNGKKVQYMMLDAKFSKKENVEKNQLIELVWKYLFTTRVINERDDLHDLIIFCGKSKDVSFRDYNDITYKGIINSPSARIINLSALVDDNDSESILSKILFQDLSVLTY